MIILYKFLRSLVIQPSSILTILPKVNHVIIIFWSYPVYLNQTCWFDLYFTKLVFWYHFELCYQGLKLYFEDWLGKQSFMLVNCQCLFDKYKIRFKTDPIKLSFNMSKLWYEGSIRNFTQKNQQGFPRGFQDGRSGFSSEAGYRRSSGDCELLSYRLLFHIRCFC